MQDDVEEGIKKASYDVQDVPKAFIEKAAEEKATARAAAAAAAAAADAALTPMLPGAAAAAAAAAIAASSPTKLPEGVTSELVQSLGLDPLETAMMGKVVAAVAREARRRKKRLYNSQTPAGELSQVRLVSL